MCKKTSSTRGLIKCIWPRLGERVVEPIRGKLMEGLEEGRPVVGRTVSNVGTRKRIRRALHYVGSWRTST